MESFKVKMLVYSLILSVITTLICMAAVRFQADTPSQPSKTMNSPQALSALEKAAPQSPMMKRIIESEKDTSDAAGATAEK